MNSLTVVYTTLFVVSIFFLVINAVMQIRIKSISESTHQIVNSQRSAMQRAIWILSKRIALEHPEDADAQEAEMAARQELELLDKPRRVQI